VNCFNCHQDGHLSRDCPERQTVDENTVPKSESKPVTNEDHDGNAETTEEQVNEEPETPKLTLAEWKAQQKREKVQFNSRQADRTDKTLQNFEVLKRDADKSGEDSYEFEEVEIQSKRAQNTKVLDIDVNFANNARGPSTRQNERRPQGGARPAAGNNNRSGAAASSGPSSSGRRPAQRLNLASDFPALG